MLIAHDVTRGACRNFVLARIQAAKPTGARFDPPANFDRERQRGSLGRFTGETEYDVRIVIDADVAP